MNPSHLIRASALAALALLLLPTFAGAIPGIQSLCGGTTTTAGAAATFNGIISQAPVIGTGTAGAASVIGITVLIMLTVLLACAVLYMIAQVASIPSLGNFAKVELAEMAGTAILIAIFFGGFYAAAFAGTVGAAAATTPANPALHFNGPARSVFVGDCTILGNTSVALIPPLFSAGVVSFGFNLIDSLTVRIMPAQFGISDTPLAGLAMVPKTLSEIQGVVSVFILAILAIMFMLGVIYSLFPLFLYIGIVLRALPWTRAAGGMFIAMFIGFYMVFPIMLHATLTGFGALSHQNAVSYYNSAASNGISSFVNSSSTGNNIGTFTGSASQLSSSGGLLNYFGGIAYSVAGFPGGYGAINGFINDFLGGAVVVMVDIVLCLIVALDFTDILSDILGAPSLSAQGLLSKVL